MGDVLRELRQYALKILQHIETVEHNITSFNYILVPFNDPDIEAPVVTKVKNEFLMALHQLKVYGGGDCPEPSLTALKSALQVSSNKSHIFLFTDADPKEKFISAELYKLLESKKPSLYFIISGKCDSVVYDPIYEQLANFTHGQYINIHNNEVNKLLGTLESNLKLNGDKKDNFSENLQQKKQLPQLIFYQSPRIAFETDDIIFNCSLSLLPHSLSPSLPITLTLYLNGKHVLEETFSRNIQNGSILYRINLVNGYQHNGEYKCVLSRQSVANESLAVVDVKRIFLKAHNKNHVKTRVKSLPIMRGTKSSVTCPLNFLDKQNIIVGWQKNDIIIENPDTNVLEIDSAEVLASDFKLKCFKIHKKQEIKEEIVFNIIVGDPPSVMTSSYFDEFMQKIVLDCDVVVKNVTSIQIFDGTMSRCLVDSRDQNSDLHTEFLEFNSQHHLLKAYFTIDQYSNATQPFSCVTHSLFGSKQMVINVDRIKIQPTKGTQDNFSYATGTTSVINSHTKQNFTPPQKNVKVNEGNSLVLSCTDKESHPFNKQDNILWVKDNQRLPGVTSNNFVLNFTTSHDEGIYRCFMQNHEKVIYNVKVMQQPRKVRQDLKSPQMWTEWSDFGDCSVTCDTGFRTRTRKCLLPENNCKETNFEVELCRMPPCGARRVPEAIKTGPGIVEWMGHSFDPYKDREYHEFPVQKCRKGFTMDIFSKKCVDINECKIRTTCPHGLRCHNTRGGYKCMTCPKGFMGINGRCLDLNECSLRTHKCSQICINVRGSYRCDCKRGYSLHLDGFQCNYQGFN
uniref:CSON013764 protein n=1 Tax=Culicoides sonorensis TaxID=179676 RepID=A0A336M8U4_CULSO